MERNRLNLDDERVKKKTYQLKYVVQQTFTWRKNGKRFGMR
jgi:hypothetical protein